MPKRTSLKTKLTDRLLRSLKPKPDNYLIYDTEAHGLAIKVTTSGHRVGILYKRLARRMNSSKKTLGWWPETSLSELRARAHELNAAIRRGEDPRRQETSTPLFKDALDEYVRLRLSRSRKNATYHSELARLVKRWGKRQLDEVTRQDIVALCNDCADVPGSGHMLFGHTRAFFNWAVSQGLVAASPCTGLRPSQLIGPKQARQRVLNDAEMAAVWNAAEALGLVWSGLYRLLIVSIQRKSEIADLQWSEIDFDQGLIVIPAARYKSAAPHLIPLSSLALDILKSIPRGASGPYVFSLDGGAHPIRAFARSKSRLDKLLPDFPPWVVHDLRRTGRTNLAKLKVPTDIAELVLGHAQRGLVGVYDRHAYVEERREALELWAQKLQSIVK